MLGSLWRAQGQQPSLSSAPCLCRPWLGAQRTPCGSLEARPNPFTSVASPAAVAAGGGRGSRSGLMEAAEPSAAAAMGEPRLLHSDFLEGEVPEGQHLALLLLNWTLPPLTAHLWQRGAQRVGRLPPAAARKGCLPSARPPCAARSH